MNLRFARPFAATLLVACATTTSGGPASDASTDGPVAIDAGAGDAAAEAGPPKAQPPDPGKIVCGSEICDLPGSVCCYSSVAPGGPPDHCEPDAKTCNAPNSDCDEAADCAAGQLCCTGTSVLPRDASVNGLEAMFCIEEANQGSCLERPGVGSSSIQVCKKDSECKNGKKCVTQTCYGRTLQTCGADPSCR